MADDRPLWRKAYDAIEQQVAPRLEAFIRTDQFADLAAIMNRFNLAMQERMERASRQNLHRWNLPAGSDVKRLSEQIASLERRVRDLTRELEAGGSRASAEHSQPKGSRRAHPA